MPSTKDIDLLGSPLKILLVSSNGMGKTICAASFHKQGPVRIEDSDVRMKPIKAYFPDADIDYQSWTSENFGSFVTRVHDIIDGKLVPKFKTWVIDSMTGFSIASITYQLRVKDNLVKKSKGGLPVTGWDEINGETVLFHNILEAAQVLYTKHKCNIIMTAHPISKTEIVKDEESKKVISLAAYGNKIPSIIPGFFDEIYNIQFWKTLVDGKPHFERRVYTVPMENMPGKTALYNYLPDSMDITNKNFYDVLTSYMKPKA